MTQPPKVLIHNSETDAMAEVFRAAHPDLPLACCNSFDGLADAVADHRPDVVYSVRFTSKYRFPREALLDAGGPRWVANGGSGVDHLAHWDTSRVTVTNSAGVAADMMAEYVMGGFLHFALDVPGLQRDQAAHRWDAGRLVVPLKGKTLLIVGLGQTGRAIASRAQAFGMHVIGTRSRPQEMVDVDEVHAAGDLLSLVPRADAIAICTPLTPQTRGLINAAAFAAMKPGVWIADVSRGGVIDEAALMEALAGDRIGGAALDVFATEPLPAGHALWDHPRVLISPHCSSVHAEWEMASFQLFLRNLDNYLAGRPLFNVVDPDRGY